MRGSPPDADRDGDPPSGHAASKRTVFDGLARFVVRHRSWVIAIDVAISLVFVALAVQNFEISNSFEAFMDPDSEARTTLESVKETFGDDQRFLLSVEGDVYSMEYLERLRALHHDLETIETQVVDSATDQGTAAGTGGPALGGFDDFGDTAWGDESGGSVVDEVVSLINVRDTRWEAGTLRVAGLLDHWPEASEVAALQERLGDGQRPASRLVAPSGELSVILVRTVPLDHDDLAGVYDALKATAAEHEAEGFRLEVGGGPALYAVFDRMTSADLLRLTSTVVLVLLVVFGIMFRSALRALTPLLTVLHALAWTIGTMALLGLDLTLVTIVLYPLLLCVGVASAIHVEMVYLLRRAAGSTREAAIVDAVNGTAWPVILTAVTTAVGLSSYLVTGIPPVRDLGMMGAFGVMIACGQALTWVPAMLTFDPAGEAGRRPPAGQVWFRRIAMLGDRASRSLRGRALILGGFAAVALGAAWGMAQVEVTHDTLTYLPVDHEVRASTRLIDQEVGGTNTISVLVGADDVRDLEVLRGMAAVEADLKAHRSKDGEALVTAAEGLVQMVREGWRSLHEDQDAWYRLPASQQGVVDTLTLLEADGQEHLGRVVTLDYTQALLTFQVLWRDSASYHSLVEELDRSLDEHLRGVATARSTGSVLGNVTVENQLTGGLFKSLGLAIAVITVLMLLFLRDVKLGLVAMIPNLAPIALVLGVMGVLGIPIDVQNVLIASLVLGIAVDDTIHFFHQFRTHFQRFGDRDAAIAFALDHAGVAIATTSALLVIGFGAHVSSIMVNTRVFGGLVALAIAFAFFADVFLAPALLRVLYPERQSLGVTHVAAESPRAIS